MNRILLVMAALCCLSLLLAFGCREKRTVIVQQPQPVIVQPAPGPVVVMPEPPPPIIVERRPPLPGPGYVWVPGYWGHDHGRYAWVPGRYGRPPHARAQWVQPRWDRTEHGYRHVPGGWR
jgi:hypothetical protein